MNTMYMYKQFRIDKSGKLHPLFVFAQETIETNKWLMAKDGPMTPDGKVASKLGKLAYRPGWHLSELPYAPHIGIKEGGKIKYMHDDTVWALCEINAQNDYTALAAQNGMKGKKFNPRLAYLPHVPEDGFYWYTTNPNAKINWVITGDMRVLRVLNDDECEQICAEHGFHAQPHRKITKGGM